jgi:hypothetical protein
LTLLPNKGVVAEGAVQPRQQPPQLPPPPFKVVLVI